MAAASSAIPKNVDRKVNQLFDDFIAQVRIRQVQYETKTLSDQQEHFFKLLASADEDQVISLSRALAQMHFVKKIIIDFVEETKELPVVQLAFDFNDSQVLIWAVVKDDDEETEKELILTTARINDKYYSHSFCIDLMFTQESDNYPIPAHYRPVKKK